MIRLSKPSDNMGGLLKLWAVPKSDYYINGQILTFSNTDKIYQLYCSAESLAYKEPSKQTKAGIIYNCSVSGFIPKDTEEVRVALTEMEYRPYVVIFQDGNGNFKLSGTTFYPLRLAASLKTGKQTRDRAGYEIQFSGETLTRAVFINNPF
jgi:hypothetical protein